MGGITCLYASEKNSIETVTLTLRRDGRSLRAVSLSKREGLEYTSGGVDLTGTVISVH